MSFSQIIGQDRAIGILQGCIHRNRVASTYLFAGESGIGKKLAALNFAKTVNCSSSGHDAAPLLAGFGEPADSTSPDSATDACEQCSSCEKINSGSHPDVFLMSPDRGAIKIGQIRRTEGSGGVDEDGNPFFPLEDFLKYNAHEALMRFVIIDDADLMNDPAANALLKTLEEPPADTVIILVSSRPDRLLPTIRSRASRVNFSTLSTADCTRVLESTGAAVADATVRLSMGRPGLAVDSDLMEERSAAMNQIEAMLRAERDSWPSREHMERWFDHAAVLLRDLAMLKTTGQSAALVNGDLADQIQRMGKSVDLQGIIETYQKLLSLKGLLTFNPNKSITWNYAAAILRSRLTG